MEMDILSYLCMLQMSREAIEGSLTISFSNLGQGLCEVPINEFMSAGTYEPTSTFEHELPVYEKKGDKNVKMKACFNTWEIRALIVANQHDYSNVIAKGCAFDDNILPVQLDASRWKFKHGFDFGASKECLVTPTSKTYLPPDIFSQLSENRKSVSCHTFLQCQCAHENYCDCQYRNCVIHCQVLLSSRVQRDHVLVV